MSEPRTPHLDVAGYAMGRLTASERNRFEAHLRGCEDCRADLNDLRETAGLLALAPPAAEPPADLEVRVMGAVERARQEAAAPERRREPRRRGLALRGAVAAVGVAAIAGAFVLGGRLADDGPAGVLEVSALLRPPEGGSATASVTVRMTGIGRVVRLSSDDLPILPKGELYEVWFVGPEDRPGAPQRISAGTFHPAPDGSSRVELTAAVDPTLYPIISVTAEPGDGDPLPGPEVLRSRA